MKKPSFTHSGFTLVEVLMAVGLSAGVALTAGYIITTVAKQQKQSQNMAENASDNLLIRKVLLKDWSRCASSFNTMDINDDSNLGFFDYIPDQPCSKNQICERTLTLSEGKSLWLIVSQNLNDQKPTLFDPATADTNSDNQLSDDESIVYLKIISLYQKDAFLFFYSPVSLRKTTDAIPNIVFFLGQVTQNGILPVPIPLKNKHPLFPEILINSLDAMAAHLPMAGGPATLSFVRPVALVQYKLHNGELTRSVISDFSNAAQPQAKFSFLVANKIDKIIFKRATISSPVLSFEIIPKK